MEQNHDTGVEKPYWTVPKKLLALFLCAVLIISGASLIFQTYRDYKNRSVWVVEADGIKICPGETKARKLQKADYIIAGEGSGWNQRVEANRYTVVAVKKATGKTSAMRVIFANPSNRAKKVKDCEIWAVSLDEYSVKESGIQKLLIGGRTWQELTVEQLTKAYGEPELYDEKQIGGRSLKNYRWITNYNGMNISMFEDGELVSISSWHGIPYTHTAMEADFDSSAKTNMEETTAANETMATENPSAAQDGSAFAVQVQSKQAQTVLETAPGSISMEDAKSIALKDAGISGESISHSAAKLDWEDGRQVYEVDFFSVGIEYEYEILASDGTILKKKQDAEWGKNSGTPAGQLNAAAGQTGAGQSGVTQETTGTLTIEQARQKVAERIPGVNLDSIYMKEDRDDGRLRYEGEVYYNQTKYDFELDAATGTFTDWEEETGK